MKMKTSKTMPEAGMYLVLMTALFMLSAAPAWADKDCKASGGLKYICGPQNAEDILQLGHTRWLITSGMDGSLAKTNAPGHIYLVDSRNKTYEEFFPGAHPVFRQDRQMFPDCPGPINPKKFSAHGIALRKWSAGRYRLYITSHGEREAIEIFDIDTNGDNEGGKPAIAWMGCVPLPMTMWPNSVVILSDGGFVTTKFSDPTDPDAFDKIMRGKISGSVYEWHPGGEVTEIPGTALSGPNGIALSQDERYIYVDVSGTHKVVRYDRTARPVTAKSVTISIRPDNIRWGDDGMLYTVGDNYVPYSQCAALPCGVGWSIIRIDPRTMSAERVAGAGEDTAIPAPSVAVPVGNEFWIGSFAADRIGYMPRPDAAGKN
jgi:hypothetical protein